MSRRAIESDVDRRVRTQARQRCGYCRAPQHLVMARLEIEHIIPLARGGNDDETNLWLACPICNGHKSDKVEAVDPETRVSTALFNPRTMQWSEHFHWADDGIHITGTTTIGRATVKALHMNDDPDALMIRAYWVLAGWQPPIE
jgi:hypothetical protein